MRAGLAIEAMAAGNTTAMAVKPSIASGSDRIASIASLTSFASIHRGRVLKRVRGVDVEEAAAVGAEHVDCDL